MNTNPLYTFENGASLGIDLVPITALIMIRDYGKNGDPVIITKVSNTGMTSVSNIDDFMAVPSLYDSFAAESELEKIDSVGSPAQPAWRILGRDPVNYAPGDGSVDFSWGTGQPTSPITGAQGDNSFAEGMNAKAEGDYSHAEGNGTTAEGEASHAEGIGTLAKMKGSHASGIGTITGDYEASAVFGLYNKSSVPSSKNIFEVGNGTSASASNIFEIDTCSGNPSSAGAELRAPQTVKESIIRPTALTTREYVDNELNKVWLGDLVDVTAVPEVTDLRVYQGNYNYIVGDIIKDPSGVIYRCTIAYTSWSKLDLPIPDLGGTQARFDAEAGNWVVGSNNAAQNHLMVYDPIGSTMGTGRWENIQDLDMGYYP